MRGFERRRNPSADPGRVVIWRVERLRNAGFQAWLAEALVRDRRYDVHALLDLIDKGCPAEVAARILAPLGRAQEGSTSRVVDGRSAGVARTSMGAESESRVWMARLSATGAERDAALVELHVLVSRAARFEVRRRRAAIPQLHDDDCDDLAHQCADCARIAILGNLPAIGGERHFKSWAYKFALREAAATVRKRAWKGREIPLVAESWPQIVDDSWSAGPQPLKIAETLAVLRAAVQSELSPHQREVLVAIALNGVPIDVLAHRFNTTRGALYTTLHDGRQKLRAALKAHGLVPTSIRISITTFAGCDGVRLVMRLTGPRGPELTCDECFDALERYVELELDESGADATIPGMHTHLEGCPACAEDHESLRALLATKL